MDLSHLISADEVYKQAKLLAESKGKLKSFEPTKRYLAKRKNSFYKYLKDESNLETFCDSLKNYKLSPYRGFALYKKTNEKGIKEYRPLLIPENADRLLFSIVNKKMFPLFEEHMKKFNSLGIGLTENMKKISSGPTIEELIALNADGYTYVLKTDFKRFFCTIPRGRLLEKVKKFVMGHTDGPILYDFIKKSLYNNISSDGHFKKEFLSWQLNLRGVPQGLAYSSLLASFYGTILDSEIECVVGVKHKRYLDDMIILGKTQESVNYAYLKLKEVSEKIGLDLHDLSPVSAGKTFMVNSTNEPYLFLGIEIRGGVACIPEKAIKRFKGVIEQEIFTDETIKNYKPERIKEVFNSYTFGWKKAYSSAVSPSNFTTVIQALNKYLDDYLSKENKSVLKDYVFNL